MNAALLSMKHLKNITDPKPLNRSVCTITIDEYYEYNVLHTRIYYPAGICPTICMSYLESREKAYVIPVAIITCRSHNRMEDYFSKCRPYLQKILLMMKLSFYWTSWLTNGKYLYKSSIHLWVTLNLFKSF